jgi:type I restriction enzyme, S subunit
MDMLGDVDTNTHGYPIIELGDLIVSGPTNGLYKPASAYGDGTRILRINNFYDGVISDQFTLRRLRVSDTEASRFALREGDIIVNRVNSREYLGKSAIVPKLAEPVVFESNMMRLSLDERLMLPDVCIALLQMPAVKRQIASKTKDAVNQSSINQSDVCSLRIPLPPSDVQTQHCAVIKKAQRLAELALRSGRDFEVLFASLQSRAFNGQL